MGGNGRYWAVLGGMAAGALVVGGTAYRLLPPVTAHYRADIHSEYVKYASGRDTITAYLAYPERKDPAPGFVAIAPDLLSRRGGTPPSTDDARKLIAGLDPDTVTKDLDATVAYVKRIKAARGDRVGVIGFCWGGGQSFRYATNNPSLGAFVVCFGQGPDAMSIARIRAKGLGVYAENDARINAGLAEADAAIRTYHKTYRYTVYPGVGHGFLRAREKPEVADSAWKAVVGFFRESLEH